MSYNLHPFNQAREATEYPTFSNNLNTYNYKDLGDRLNAYQKQQDMYYYTRQLNPISLIQLGPEWMDPNNLPPNIRPPIYDKNNLGYLERSNQCQTPQNNSYLWRDNLPPKAGYYRPGEPLPDGVPIQISSILAGQATSYVPFHGMQLY